MSRRSRLTCPSLLALLATVLIPTPAIGAPVDATPTSADGESLRADSESRAGEVGAFPDFDGDGYADIVVPATDEVVDGVQDAGGVYVIHGSRWGPRVMRTQRWTQNSPGIYGVAEINDWFGYGWAAGDFNGDGYDDLAVGAGGEDLGGVANAGLIHLIYGSADGLRAAGNRIISQASGAVPGDPTDGDSLGGADMAAGDFDGDGYHDLAAPVTNDEVGTRDNAGAVLVLRGSRWGLTTSGSQLFTQDSPGIVGVAEANDFWSYAGMATGDFNDDGRDDLYVSAGFEDLGALGNAGGFHILNGSASGLRGQGSRFFTAATSGFPGDNAAGAWLGYAHPAVADFDGDGLDDLALPWPYADVTVGGTNHTKAGIVVILHGSAAGLTATGSTTWSQQTPRVPGWSTTDGNWGFFSAAAGDFDRDRRVDLAVAAAGETVGANGNAGALYVIQTDGAENIRRVTRITEDTTGLQGAAANNWFTDGPLVAGDWNGDGADDLAVAATGYDLPAVNTVGAVYLFTGQRWKALSGDAVRFLTQDSPGIPSPAEPNEWWGYCCY